LIDIPHVVEYITILSFVIGIGIILFIGYKIRKINPNMYYEYRIFKDKPQQVLNFKLILVMLGFGFTFVVAAFAISNLTLFMIFNQWILGDFSGKIFITTAIAAGILFYFQMSYFFLKDHS